MSTQYDSRTADKFVVRLPDGLRADIERAAGECDTSMNTVFVQAVRQYLDIQQRQKLLLDALSLAVTRKVSPSVQQLQRDLNATDERADTATSLIRRIVANFDTEIEFHEDVAPNDLEHDQVLTEMREFLAGHKPAAQPHGEPVARFESVIRKNPQAYLTEPVYQVTESEVREFARLLAEQPAPAAAVTECGACPGCTNGCRVDRESPPAPTAYDGFDNGID